MHLCLQTMKLCSAIYYLRLAACASLLISFLSSWVCQFAVRVGEILLDIVILCHSQKMNDTTC